MNVTWLQWVCVQCEAASSRSTYESRCLIQLGYAYERHSTNSKLNRKNRHEHSTSSLDNGSWMKTVYQENMINSDCGRPTDQLWLRYRICLAPIIENWQDTNCTVSNIICLDLATLSGSTFRQMSNNTHIGITVKKLPWGQSVVESDTPIRTSLSYNCYWNMSSCSLNKHTLQSTLLLFSWRANDWPLVMSYVTTTMIT